MPVLTTNELDRFCRELSHMARANISLPDGLRQLSVSIGRGRLKSLSDHAAGALTQGRPLSQALQDAPVTLPPEFIAMVQCAEISGDLGAILQFATNHSRRVRRHRAAIFSSLLYPMVVFAVGLVIVFVMANFVVPEMKRIFDELGATELPAITDFAVWAASLLQGVSGIAIASTLGIGILLMLSPIVRAALHRLLAAVPGYGSLIGLSDSAVLGRFLSQMLQRGVPLHMALRAASLAVWQSRSKRMLLGMATTAEKGHTVGHLLTGDVPSTAAYLFRQAEQRGNLAEACTGIAEYCEDRFDRLSRDSANMLEPLLVVVMGVIVGFFVIAMYLPLFMIPSMMGTF